MAQTRYVNFGSLDHNSDFKNIISGAYGACVLSGLEITPHSSDGSKVVVAPGSWVTTAGLIIYETASKEVVVVDGWNTIVYTHVDRDIIGGVSATLVAIEGQVSEYAYSTILGWAYKTPSSFVSSYNIIQAPKMKILPLDKEEVEDKEYNYFTDSVGNVVYSPASGLTATQTVDLTKRQVFFSIENPTSSTKTAIFYFHMIAKKDRPRSLFLTYYMGNNCSNTSLSIKDEDGDTHSLSVFPFSTELITGEVVIDRDIPFTPGESYIITIAFSLGALNKRIYLSTLAVSNRINPL